MEQKPIYPKGFIIKQKSENAPDFVAGKLSIKVEEFTAFMKEHQNNGWLNLDLLNGRDGLYAKLDTWKPKPKVEEVETTSIDPETGDEVDVQF